MADNENSEDTLQGRFLTFSIDRELYGIEIRYVMEIIGMQAITEMPEMPDYVKGIINLRGRIIPLMDVRVRFRKLPTEYTDRTCIIVIDFNGLPVGLIVDGVTEVQTIEEDQISDRPGLTASEGRGYIRNIGKIDNGVVLLIDCGKLLSDDEFSSLCTAV
jgi:purine-binding chemotaxis protein CheW